MRKTHTLSIAIVVCLAVIMSTIPAVAKEKNFEVTLNRSKVALGERAQLSLTFYGTQDVSAPEIKDIDGFQVRYVGPSTMMSIVNGKVSSSITHNYILIPLRVGTFELGPFVFDHGPDTYISGTVTIQVVAERAPPAPGQQVTEPTPADLKDRIFVIMSVDKRKAYINEVVPVTIKLFVNRLAVRDIQFPTFGQEGFSKAEFEKPRQYQEVIGVDRYDVIEFKTSVFGTRTGEFTLGPAAVKCNLVFQRDRRGYRPRSYDDFFGGSFDDSFFDDFMNRYETYPIELKSAEVPITIEPLPEEGKPADFTGAIGDYQFILKAEPKEVNAGDPVTLEMSIYGKGNYTSVNAPLLEETKGFKVYEPSQRVTENGRVFEQVIIPESDEVKEVPRIGFSFFDPDKAAYRRLAQGPLPITVKRIAGAAKPQIVSAPIATSIGPREEMLGRDIIYIKESIGSLRQKGVSLYRRPLFMYLQFVPILLLISIAAFHRRTERLRKDQRYARLIRAPKEARRGIAEARRLLKEKKSEEFYGAIFKTLQGYLGNRLHLPSAGITAEIIDDAFRPKGADPDIVKKLEGLFRDCDMARYAASSIPPDAMKHSLRDLEECIQHLERQKII